MLPPKIGLGHDGSSAGADHFSVFFSAFSAVFSAATAALRSCCRGGAAAGRRSELPAKLLRWAVHWRCVVCIVVIMTNIDAVEADEEAGSRATGVPIR